MTQVIGKFSVDFSTYVEYAERKYRLGIFTPIPLPGMFDFSVGLFYCIAIYFRAEWPPLQRKSPDKVCLTPIFLLCGS